MLRIVGIQRSESANREFVLLQNQGVMRVGLRGHVLAESDALENLDTSRMFAFSEDEPIPPAHYVALITGFGQNGWGRGSDGSPIFHVFWNRSTPAWGSNDAVHLLAVSHTHRHRPEGLLVSR